MRAVLTQVCAPRSAPGRHPDLVAKLLPLLQPPSPSALPADACRRSACAKIRGWCQHTQVQSGTSVHAPLQERPRTQISKCTQILTGNMPAPMGAPLCASDRRLEGSAVVRCLAKRRQLCVGSIMRCLKHRCTSRCVTPVCATSKCRLPTPGAALVLVTKCARRTDSSPRLASPDCCTEAAIWSWLGCSASSMPVPSTGHARKCAHFHGRISTT